MEMDEESLADVRRDDTIKTRCVRFGVDYIERRHGETSAEQQQRHNTLQKTIDQRERDVHVRNNRQRNVGRHRMLIQLHESEQEHSNRKRNLDRHRMPTLLHESEQENSNRKRNETMEGVRIEKHAGGKDQ